MTHILENVRIVRGVVTGEVVAEKYKKVVALSKLIYICI